MLLLSGPGAFDIWYNSTKILRDKNKNIKALIDLGSKINAIHSTYIIKLGFYAKKVDVSI